MITSQTNHILSPDTQATLLLCAGFGQKRTVNPQPLTLREYNDLALWLKNNDLTPQDLLDSTIQNKLSDCAIAKLDSYRIVALLKRGVMLSLAVEQWTNQGIWIMARGDAEYPKRLKQKLKYRAPAILYGVGDKKLLSQGGLAIVGSRDIDDAGLEYTQKVTQACAEQSIQVISGGARGVDQASMMSALEAGGTVVGVMADSLVKAAISKKHRQGIQEGKLALISTYDPNAGFNVGNAMGRNKYIYALSDYALVVNSTVNKGGTWAGAIEALSKITDVPVLVRIEKNANNGNQKLQEKGAIPFPETPGKISLRESITERILKFKNRQKIETTIKQTSLLDYIDATSSNAENTAFNSQQEDQPVSLDISDIQSSNNIGNCKIPSADNPQNVYEAVLPFILKHLNKPRDDRFLADSLEVQIGQMRLWLKKAVAEGIIKKNQKPVTYQANSNKELSLLNKSN